MHRAGILSPKFDAKKNNRNPHKMGGGLGRPWPGRPSAPARGTPSPPGAGTASAAAAGRSSSGTAAGPPASPRPRPRGTEGGGGRLWEVEGRGHSSLAGLTLAGPPEKQEHCLDHCAPPCRGDRRPSPWCPVVDPADPFSGVRRKEGLCPTFRVRKMGNSAILWVVGQWRH